MLTSPQRYIIAVVQQLSHVPLFVTPQTATCQASLSFTIFQSLLKLMSVESVMPTNHRVLCSPLFLLPSIFASIRVFSSESAFHIRWPKHWSSSFSISPSNEYSGLISFSISSFDLLSAFSPERYTASFLKFSFYFILAYSCFTILCYFQVYQVHTASDKLFRTLAIRIYHSPISET